MPNMGAPAPTNDTELIHEFITAALELFQWYEEGLPYRHPKTMRNYPATLAFVTLRTAVSHARELGYYTTAVNKHCKQ